MPRPDDAADSRRPTVTTIAHTKAGSVAATPAVPEPAVDHGIEESFPASDPVSVSITKVLVASDEAADEAIADTQQESDAQPDRTSDQPAGPRGRVPSVSTPQLNPADEAAPGTPGTGETFCPVCGGSGRFDETPCKACGGTGQVTVGIGGA